MRKNMDSEYCEKMWQSQFLPELRLSTKKDKKQKQIESICIYTYIYANTDFLWIHDVIIYNKT